MNKCEQYCRTIQRLCNNRKSILPAGYTAVEYLQSNGQQWINIGSIANHTYFDIDLAFVNWVNNQYASQYNFNGIIGCNGVKVNNVPIATKLSFYWYDNAPGLWASVKTVDMNSGYGLTTGTRYNVYLSATTYTVDGTPINTTTSTWETANADCYVFSCNTSANQPWLLGSAMRLYHLKTSSADLYPCIRDSDSKPGLYDILSDTFYTNLGSSGDFTTGAIL